MSDSADASSGGYDIVILGGGSGGYACALRAAELGKRVALIEEDKVGGTCLHRGCIPTKALLHSAEVADHAQRGAERSACAARFDGIDMNGVNDYKDKVVTRLWKGLTGLVASRQIEVIEGHGKLISPTAVQVGDQVVTGEHVVLATGSQTRSLPGLVPDGHRIITSDHALQLDHVPASVVILGGGVIGVEFASVWRSFGAEVTIVEMLPHLLPTEEESSSKLLERAFRRRGIGFKLGTKFESVKDTGNGVTVTLEGGATIDAELLLVAVGRGPVSAGLGYDEVGVAMDRGFVLVDELCRTNIPTVSAVGDLRPGLAAGARRVRRGHHGGRAARRACPSCRSTTTACRGSPTPIPRSPRSASRRRRPRPAASSSPSSPTTWPGTARARSCRPAARRRSSSPRVAARRSACTWSARGWASSSPRRS